MTTLHLGKSISRSPLRRAFLLISLALVGFALLPRAQAVSPPPDGDYGNGNTAEGLNALFSLNGGLGNNTAIGAGALYSNMMGFQNTANGSGALNANTTGNNNTANGFKALFRNTGSENTANGALALLHNTTGDDNMANGQAALVNNTTGDANTANGYGALYYNTTGSNNTANGFNALFRNTGSNNIALGSNAGIYLTTGNSNIDIGNHGLPVDEGKIRIGIQGTHTGTFIAGIYNVAVNGSPVVVNSNGKLGVTTSSARFKDAIKPMDKASEAILGLKPVTFHYKKEVDADGIPQFGLVAEQVEKINPDLVARDANGKVYTVRYDAVNAMLLNEFLKEHRKVEKLTKDFRATVAQQQKQIEALTAQLKEQAAQIQKVTAQLEVNKTVPKIVLNNQ
jgi:hypothetical protein